MIMISVKKLLNLNLARFRLKAATLGIRTTAAGREFQMSTNIKILCRPMIIKLKFTKPEVKFHITRTRFIGYQYFVSFVFVMRA